MLKLDYVKLAEFKPGLLQYVCSLILFIVTNKFSIITRRQNHLDMYRNNYVAETAESFFSPLFFVAPGGNDVMAGLLVMVSCSHGGASQKDWERVCYGSGACRSCVGGANVDKIRVNPKKSILQTAGNGLRSNPPNASPLK